MEEELVSAPVPGMVMFVVAIILCAVVLALSAKAGARVGLVDKPDERKRHKGNIPLVGGLSIFVTYAALQLSSADTLSTILAGGLVLLVGMADDYRELSPLFRLVIQCIAASILVLAGGHHIVTLGAILTSDPVVLSGIVSIVFSIVCVVGVINATNMIDGVDGLAGGIVTISLLALLLLVLIAGGTPSLIAGLLIIIGATGTFLLFNTGFLGAPRRIFLGDSGTMFLGVLLASYYISFSQGENPYMAPVVAGWIFGLPLMDSVAVMVGRLARGSSPLRGGRDHLHHKLIDNGVSERSCVLIMLSIHCLLVFIGVAGNYFAFSTQCLFWGFVVAVAVHFFVTPKIIEKIRVALIK